MANRTVADRTNRWTTDCYLSTGCLPLSGVTSVQGPRHPAWTSHLRHGDRRHDHANSRTREHDVQHRRPGDAHHPPTRCRGIDLGNPRRQLRPDVPVARPRRQRRHQSDLVLVPDSELEEPDAHTQSRHDLPDAVLQHEGCRTVSDRDPTGRRGLDHRHDHELLAGCARGCRPGGAGHGQRRQVPDHATRIQRQDS